MSDALIRRVAAAVIAVCVAGLAGAVHAQADKPAAAVAVATPPPPRTQSTDALRLVDLWLEAQVAYERIPAVSAGVVIGQELVWSKAYGQLDARRQVPAATDTIYSVCSISKLFTAIAVMQLVEAGKLSLEDDIGKRLPEFALQRQDPDSGPITLRSLLSHSSGLPREADFGYWTAPDFVFPTRAQMLARLRDQRSFMRVGDHYQYSNLGMALLGEVVAAASGLGYEDYVQRHILGPLNLVDTRPSMPTAQFGTRLAVGHGALKRDGSRDLLPVFDTRGLAAAAGFTSTVPDLARFAAWQFRLHKAGGSEVLRVASLREMHRVQWTDPDGKATWGLGFAVSRDGANILVSHGGTCPGYLSAVVLALKDEVAVIAMANANGAGTAPFARPIRQLVLKGLRLPVAPQGPGSPVLAAYAGRYASQPWSSEEVIVPWGNGLAQLDLPNTDPAGRMTVLRHVAGDRFREVRDDGSLGAEVAFERGSDGQVSGYTAWSQRNRRVEALLP